MQVQTEQQPEVNPNVIQVDQTEYNASCQKYEKLANLRLRNSDTIVLGGYGCFIKVSNDAFVVEYQKPHEPGVNKLLKLSRGVHKIKQIVITVHGGYITLDALEWLAQQKITLYLLSYTGEVLQVLTPKQPRNARLSYLQYQANQSDLALSISVELVRRKTLAQLETLARYPQLEKQPSALVVLEKGLCELHRVSTLEKLRTVEGIHSHLYFNAFTGMPIKWAKAVTKTLPPHWLSITERNSPLSKHHGAWRSINPFHSCLNFAYALLECQVLQAIHIAGLEPTMGFLHAYTEGKNTLVFDLMECLRATVDHMVLSFFQKTVFHKGDFTQELSGECHMGNEELKRYILASCRVHPVEIDRVV